MNDPIVIDSDDDYDFEPISQIAGPSRLAGRPVARHVKKETTTAEGSRDTGAGSRDALKVALAKLDSEIRSVKDQLEPLQALYTSLLSEREGLEHQLSASRLSTAPKQISNDSAGSRVKIGNQNNTTIDYTTSSFPWSPAILSALRKTFNLPSFRLCQEGVINAALDDRDIVCVMPTGGGKSLTYQLPAVIGGKGLTVVISPLLALIWDQVRALKELGVECVMLTGTTSKEEQNDAFRRMEDGGRNGGGKEIRLCYLTPEKIAKSKRLMSVLEKVNASGRLTRFVIDEAHCCSQLGHDFRPDYKKLSVLKTLFPRVPIQAVTATLSSKTLPDLLKILRLAPVCDGKAANRTGTIMFSAPLYRPNLHYKVFTKPSNAKTAIEKMGEWIQEHHKNESGIIYCLSKKDTETVADALREWSNGTLKTGVYHAGIDDESKERIHVKWRQGRINCICATIAFGLGIDKGDVRYVIHHSMSKSLDGYYQETGRAGRDGKDSDCVLFYRGQDASRLSSLVYSDVDGVGKLQEMLRFAQDLKTCRKVAFAKYFSASAHLSTSAWDEPSALASTSKSPSGAVSPCGQCDNCLRPPESVQTLDVTLDSWKILKVIDEVKYAGGRVTLANLSDLVRGLGGGSFAVMEEGRKGKRKVGAEKGAVDLQAVAGGKVALSKDDAEVLMIHLTLQGYLQDSYHATAYAVNGYVTLGPQALRLSRLSLDQVESGNSGLKIECTFPAPKVKAKVTKEAKKTKKGKTGDSEEEDEQDTEDGMTNGAVAVKGRVKSNGKSKVKETTKHPHPTSKKAPRERIGSIDYDENEQDYDDDDGYDGYANGGAKGTGGRVEYQDEYAGEEDLQTLMFGRPWED